MRLLITGAAGFIGFHLAKWRLKQGDTVIAIDNLNEYYDVKLKHRRLEKLQSYDNFHFYQFDLTDYTRLSTVFETTRPQRVINLAAQAGVRYSLVDPQRYIQTNVLGFTNIIESCCRYAVEHLVYASTSSIYGANEKKPYKETDEANHPLSIYAASKKANELIAHSYSHLYQLPTTGLRFFTVYGPWGRPDMAFFSFTKNIINDKPIQVYNYGNMQRDFTYIDDIVSGISLVIDRPASADSTWSATKPKADSSIAPYKIYNIGYGRAVNLLDYIQAIETVIGKKAIIEFLPLQAGDVLATHADVESISRDLGYIPQIDYKEGISRFVQWYLDYYPVTV